MSVKKITIQGLVAAIYVVLTILSETFGFLTIALAKQMICFSPRDKSDPLLANSLGLKSNFFIASKTFLLVIPEKKKFHLRISALS